MFDATPPPLAFKTKRQQRADRAELTAVATSGDPTAYRLHTAFMPIQVLLRRYNGRASRLAARLGRRFPKLIQCLVVHTLAQHELVKANAELDRLEEKHHVQSPGRFARVMRRYVKYPAIALLGLLDDVAYMPAVSYMFDIQTRSSFGKFETALLAAMATGMVITSAAAAHFLKLLHEDRIVVAASAGPTVAGEVAERDGQPDEAGAATESRAIHGAMALLFGFATFVFLVGGSYLRAANAGKALLSGPGLAMLAFSAIPLAAAAAIEYLTTSSALHLRDGILNEQRKAVRRMRRSCRVEGRYRATWERLNFLWSVAAPNMDLQLLAGLSDVLATCQVESSGIATQTDELRKRYLDRRRAAIAHLDPAKAERKAREQVTGKASLTGPGNLPLDEQPTPPGDQPVQGETGGVQRADGQTPDEGASPLDVRDHVIAPGRNGSGRDEVSADR